jgi:hypothetical protein
MQPDSDFDAKIDAHHSAVGMIASTWAGFEQLIQLAVWNLAGLDNLTGAAITTQIGNSGRLLDAIIALLRLKGASEEEIKPVNLFAEKIGRRQRQRNRFIHDPWSFRMPHGQPHRFEVSARRDVVSTQIPHTTQELLDFHKEIIALAQELDTVLKAVRLPPSSPAKHP